MGEDLVPQIEAAVDPTVVVDQLLLKVLGSLGLRALSDLSRVVADVHAGLVLSIDVAELQMLRQAPGSSAYEWRPIDGEVRLTVPPSGSGDWLGEGLRAQIWAAPSRWRDDVASALFTLVVDLEDAARARRRRRLFVLVAATGGVVGLVFTRTAGRNRAMLRPRQTPVKYVGGSG